MARPRKTSVPPASGILCPECGTNSSKVTDSREAPGSIRRRRECVRCGGRWSTIERAVSFKQGSRR
jgi:transcriptional regulator NrdR family protein